MKFLHHRLFLLLLRWVIGATFVYAGAMKIGAPENFSDSIAAFAILPNSAINLMAITLPPFEILAGLAAITGIQGRPALLALGGLTLVFLIALVSAVARGITVDCGCFGSGTPSAWSMAVAIGRDLLLLAGCIWGYRTAGHEPGAAPDQNRADEEIPAGEPLTRQGSE